MANNNLSHIAYSIDRETDHSENIPRRKFLKRFVGIMATIGGVSAGGGFFLWRKFAIDQTFKNWPEPRKVPKRGRGRFASGPFDNVRHLRRIAIRRQDKLSWQDATYEGNLDTALALFQIEDVTENDRLAVHVLTKLLDDVWYEKGRTGVRLLVDRHRQRFIQIVRQIGNLPEGSLVLQWELLHLQYNMVDLLVSRAGDNNSPEAAEETLETIQLIGYLSQIRHRNVHGDAWTDQLKISSPGIFFDAWLNKEGRKDLEWLRSS